MADAAAGRTPRVAVVGGGVAGLAAAWELTGGPAGPLPGPPEVVVLEGGTRVGGKISTASLAGGPVDVGPDGFLGRRPEAAELCREVGLAGELVPIAASGAAVWARGRRRTLPKGLLLGVPTRLRPVARSGILSPRGTARLALDALAPRPDRRAPLGDRAIGPLLARKLGRQTVDRLADPMLGGIHAGGLADASAAALFPALLTAAQSRSGLMRALRHAPSAGGTPAPPAEEGAPLFWGVRGGLESLCLRLTAHLEARGAAVRTCAPVTALGRDGAGWVLEGPAGAERADAVVLAVPSGVAAELLAPHDTDAAGLLRAVEYASVAVVTLAYPEASVQEGLVGTGLLVPHGTPLPRVAAERAGAGRREPFLVTACTYLSAKWPHLERPGVRLLRASVGRFGDERFAALDDAGLVERVAGELGVLLDVADAPVEATVTRWPEALPQYRVHHLLRVGSVEAAVRRLGCLAVAGAAYHGVGVPACVASGRAAARDVLAQLAGLGQPARA